MTVGCQIRCKEGFFSPHGLFNCKEDFLLSPGCPERPGTSAPNQRLEWDAVCPAARGIGAGEGGDLLPGISGVPSVPGTGRGSRTGAGQAAGARRDRVRDQSPPGSPDQSVCPFPACPMGKGRPK